MLKLWKDNSVKVCRGNLCLMCCFILMTISCEQRDPLAEYEILSETVYSSPRDGEDDAQEYIDHFYKNSRARINEVSEIRNQFRQMDDFFSNSFSSYADFINQSRDLNYELSHSIHYGVRNTWFSLYGKERNRLLAPLMDSINESVFDNFFKAQVRQLCEKRYVLLEIESIDQIFLSTPTLNSDGTAKKCRGEYRIHLRGGVIGLITSVTNISIEGIIGPDESGNLTPVRTAYDFL